MPHQGANDPRPADRDSTVAQQVFAPRRSTSAVAATGSGITALTGDVTASGSGSVAATAPRLNASAPAFSATPTLDTTTASVFTPSAMTANITALNFSGTGPKVVVALLQDATGGRTVTAGASIDFGGDVPNLSGINATASGYTYLGFVYHPTTAKFRLVAISK